VGWVLVWAVGSLVHYWVMVAAPNQAMSPPRIESRCRYPYPILITYVRSEKLMHKQIFIERMSFLNCLSLRSYFYFIIGFVFFTVIFPIFISYFCPWKPYWFLSFLPFKCKLAYVDSNLTHSPHKKDIYKIQYRSIIRTLKTCINYKTIIIYNN